MNAGGDLPRSPLHELHRRSLVAFGEVDGWEMPRVFENVKLEYLAVKGTAGVMDRSSFGRLRVSGAKRIDLLHRLTTNDLKDLQPGQGARTILLTDKGRIIDDLRLYVRDDFYYLITSPAARTRVKEIIEKLRFRDDVVVEDITASTAMITLLGPQSARLLGSATGARDLEDLPPYHAVELRAGGATLLAARINDAGGAGFDLIVDAAGAPAVWNAVFDKAGPYGASPCGEEAYEMVRIEQGVPRHGRELTEECNPLEAGLNEAISWTKGCYVGQEVIARLDSREKVSRHLCGLWLEPGPIPPAGSPVEAEGRPVGRLTSVAPSLDFRRVVGLAILRKEVSAPGTPVTVIDGEDRVEAEVATLPFQRPRDRAGG